MAGENIPRLRWTKSLRRCLAPGAPRGCGWGWQAHHGGKHGTGQKPHDDEAQALCSQHHADWHNASGPFRDWDQELRRAWTAWARRLMEKLWDGRRELPSWF